MAAPLEDLRGKITSRITCEELAPDSPWRRIPDKTWPHPKGRPVLDFTAAKVRA